MKTYSIEELDRMRLAIHRLMVVREGWNPHNPYELARVVEERLRTHMQNGDNARVLEDAAYGRQINDGDAGPPPPPRPPEAFPITAVHLTRSPTGECRVEIEHEGKWYSVIEDNGDIISHIVESMGIARVLKKP